MLIRLSSKNILAFDSLGKQPPLLQTINGTLIQTTSRDLNPSLNQKLTFIDADAFHSIKNNTTSFSTTIHLGFQSKITLIEWDHTSTRIAIINYDSLLSIYRQGVGSIQFIF